MCMHLDITSIFLHKLVAIGDIVQGWEDRKCTPQASGRGSEESAK